MKAQQLKALQFLLKKSSWNKSGGNPGAMMDKIKANLFIAGFKLKKSTNHETSCRTAYIFQENYYHPIGLAASFRGMTADEPACNTVEFLIRPTKEFNK